MVTVDIQRTGYGTADQIQNHGKTGTGLYRHLLQHVQVTVGAGGVEYPCARSGRAVTDTRGAVFAVGGNQLHVMLAAGLHEVQELRHFCRRRNREISHYVIVDLMGCVRGHFVAGFVHHPLFDCAFGNFSLYLDRHSNPQLLS
ncbi:hypothetical protein D3C75_840020 [compost metagenome]